MLIVAREYRWMLCDSLRRCACVYFGAPQFEYESSLVCAQEVASPMPLTRVVAALLHCFRAWAGSTTCCSQRCILLLLRERGMCSRCTQLSIFTNLKLPGLWPLPASDSDPKPFSTK